MTTTGATSSTTERNPEMTEMTEMTMTEFAADVLARGGKYVVWCELYDAELTSAAARYDHADRADEGIAVLLLVDVDAPWAIRISTTQFLVDYGPDYGVTTEAVLSTAEAVTTAAVNRLLAENGLTRDDIDFAFSGYEDIKFILTCDDRDGPLWVPAEHIFL